MSAAALTHPSWTLSTASVQTHSNPPLPVQEPDTSFEAHTRRAGTRQSPLSLSQPSPSSPHPVCKPPWPDSRARHQQTVPSIVSITPPHASRSTSTANQNTPALYAKPRASPSRGLLPPGRARRAVRTAGPPHYSMESQVSMNPLQSPLAQGPQPLNGPARPLPLVPGHTPPRSDAVL